MMTTTNSARLVAATIMLCYTAVTFVNADGAVDSAVTKPATNETSAPTEKASNATNSGKNDTKPSSSAGNATSPHSPKQNKTNVNEQNTTTVPGISGTGNATHRCRRQASNSTCQQSVPRSGAGFTSCCLYLLLPVVLKILLS